MIRTQYRKLGRGCWFASVALIVALGILSACSLTPKQQVLPYPEHIQAGIEVGDEIEVVTVDGETHRLTVTEMTNSSIGGDGVRVPFSNIAKISRRSWKRVRNPCDDDRPLGCSIPAYVRVASEFHDRFGDHFEDSCITHDYCYRYGFKTYDHERADCDTEFLENMRAQCGEGLNLDFIWRAECRIAADQFHDVVVRRGEPSYLGLMGKYCEYAGPP